MVIDEQDELRRPDPDLGAIVDLEVAALVLGRRNHGGRFVQQVIEHAGRQALAGTVMDLIDLFKEAMDTLASLGRNEHDGRIGHERNFSRTWRS